MTADKMHILLPSAIRHAQAQQQELSSSTLSNPLYFDHHHHSEPGPGGGGGGGGCLAAQPTGASPPESGFCRRHCCRLFGLALLGYLLLVGWAGHQLAAGATAMPQHTASLPVARALFLCSDTLPQLLALVRPLSYAYAVFHHVHQSEKVAAAAWHPRLGQERREERRGADQTRQCSEGAGADIQCWLFPSAHRTRTPALVRHCPLFC